MVNALNLADEGFTVHLIERTGDLGGITRRMHYTLGSDGIQAFLADLIKKVKEHPNIKVYFNTWIVNAYGYVGNFTTEIMRYRGVTIEKIDKLLNGVTCTVPGAHHFTGLCGWEECDEMYTGIIENEGHKGTWKYGQHTYTWGLKPFLGTFATAPEWEVLSSLATSFGSAPACGGNLDCWDIREGTKVYLQSFNKGGLLFFGDMHASQGGGEVTGMANEVAGEVTLRCDVIKNKALSNIRLETPESLISVYCYRPIEAAIKLALKDLLLWLEEDYGMAKREAYILASICPECRINVYQVCSGLGRLMTTVGAEFPKKMLPG